MNAGIRYSIEQSLQPAKGVSTFPDTIACWLYLCHANDHFSYVCIPEIKKSNREAMARLQELKKEKEQAVAESSSDEKTLRR